MAIGDDSLAPVIEKGDRLLILKNRYGVVVTNPFGNKKVFFSEVAQKKDWVYYEIDNQKHIGQIQLLPNDTIWVDSTEKAISFYPYNSFYPVVVPRAGIPLKLNKYNIKMYAYTLQKYEQKRAKILNDTTLQIAKEKVHTVVFSQNYYWLLAGQENTSLQSYHFGFLPQQSLLGKVLGISYSLTPQQPLYKSVRINRTFISL